MYLILASLFQYADLRYSDWFGAKEVWARPPAKKRFDDPRSRTSSLERLLRFRSH